MPTYEYRCNACGDEHEVFQSIKDGPKKKCPACGKNALERLISGGGAVLFKGSGFYETDYRSASYKKAAEAEKKAASGESGGDAGGGEKKKPDSGGEKKTGAEGGASKPEKKPGKTAAEKTTSGSSA